jgi:hypothetical protein
MLAEDTPGDGAHRAFSRRQLLYGLGGAAAAGAVVATGSDVVSPKAALAQTASVGWFNVVDYLAARCTATDPGTAPDQTPAFLNACRAAAAFAATNNNRYDNGQATGIGPLASSSWAMDPPRKCGHPRFSPVRRRRTLAI